MVEQPDPWRPPLLQDGAIEVEQLRRWAGIFDAISDESGARYSAAAFVAWLALEVELVARNPRRRRREPAGRPGRIRSAVG